MIDNAIYYSKPNSTITVALKKTKDYAEFTVKDTGIGVPKEDQEKLKHNDIITNKFYNKLRIYAKKTARKYSLGDYEIDLAMDKFVDAYMKNDKIDETQSQRVIENALIAQWRKREIEPISLGKEWNGFNGFKVITD